MSKICGVCGKVFGNEPKFPMDGGGEMCEDCYLAFQEETAEGNVDSNVNKDILEILKNKEQYTVHKLEEVADTLKTNGCKEQAEELTTYLNNYGKPEEEDGQYYNNGKVYQGSRSNVWSNYLKFVSYISWVLTTIFGIWLGTAIGGGFGFVLGGLIGFVVGFVSIATIMMIITMCENISIMTDNTAKILAKLDDDNN